MSRARKQNDADIEKLIETVYDLRLEDPEPSLLQLINIANDSIFPPEKRKKYKSNVVAKPIVDAVKAKFKKDPIINPVSSPVSNPVSSPLPNPISSPVPNPISSPVPNPVLISAYNDFEERIVSLEKRVKSLEERKKLKIGLAGVSSKQFHDINSGLSHLVSLSFIDISYAKLSVPRNLDYVVVGKWVSHPATKKIEEYYEKEQIIIITDGGPSSIKRTIHELIKG